MESRNIGSYCLGLLRTLSFLMMIIPITLFILCSELQMMSFIFIAFNVLLLVVKMDHILIFKRSLYQSIFIYVKSCASCMIIPKISLMIS